LVELFERDSDVWICVEFRVAAQCLGDTFVVFMQDGRERSEQMCCEKSPLGIGQVKSETLNFCDGGHAWSVARRDSRASA